MSEQMETLEKRYTDKQFCEMYQVSRNTSARWRKAGTLKYILTATGRVRYLESQLAEFDRKNERLARKRAA